MKSINTIETRAINGGRSYCKMCGYGRLKNYSYFTIVKHIITRHGLFGGLKYLIG